MAHLTRSIRPAGEDAVPAQPIASSAPPAISARPGTTAPLPAPVSARPLRPAARAAEILVMGYVFVLVVLTAAGLVLTRFLLDGPVGRTDHSITAWLSDHRTSGLNRVTEVVSKSADTTGIIGVALVVVIVLATRRRWRWIGILIASLATELLCFLAVNFIVDRPRPDVAHLGSVPTTSSFPSGHSAATLILYGCIAMFVSDSVRSTLARWLFRVLAVFMPLAVAFSRVYRGMHNPLDVLAGLLMGAAILAVVLAASSVWNPPSSDEAAIESAGAAGPA